VATNDDRQRLEEASAPGTGADAPSASAPRLPVRASIYIDVDGTVHFGALFEGLVPVADALGNRRTASASETDLDGEDTSPERGGPGPDGSATK